MNSVIDISQPFYGQLLQIQKKDTPNTTVTAETQFTQKVPVPYLYTCMLFQIKNLN